MKENKRIPHQQALRLMKLGFDEWGDYVYSKDSDVPIPVVIFSFSPRERSDYYCPAPTTFQVKEWLEEKGIVLKVFPVSVEMRSYDGYTGYWGFDIKMKESNERHHNSYDTYWKAYLDGLTRCLNILEGGNHV